MIRRVLVATLVALSLLSLPLDEETDCMEGNGNADQTVCDAS